MENTQTQTRNKIKEPSGLRLFLADFFGTENNKENKELQEEVEKICNAEDKAYISKLESKFNYSVATKSPKLKKAKFSNSHNGQVEILNKDVKKSINENKKGKNLDNDKTQEI